MWKYYSVNPSYFFINHYLKNPKYDDYQRGLASMVYKFFDKKCASLPDQSVSVSGVNIPLEFNEQLAK